jgi:hypothetical protein
MEVYPTEVHHIGKGAVEVSGQPLFLNIYSRPKIRSSIKVKKKRIRIRTQMDWIRNTVTQKVDERARVFTTTSVAKFISLNLPKVDIYTST